MSSNDYFKHFQSPKMPCFMKFPFIRQPLRGRTNPPTFRGKKNGLLGKNSYDLHFGPTSHLCTHPGLKPSSSLGKVSFCCLKSPSSRLWLLSPPCISRIWFRCFSSIRTSHPPLPIPSLGQLNSLQSHLLLKKQEKKRPSSLLSLSAHLPPEMTSRCAFIPRVPTTLLLLPSLYWYLPEKMLHVLITTPLCISKLLLRVCFRDRFVQKQHIKPPRKYDIVYFPLCHKALSDLIFLYSL